MLGQPAEFRRTSPGQATARQHHLRALTHLCNNMSCQNSFISRGLHCSHATDITTRRVSDSTNPTSTEYNEAGPADARLDLSQLGPMLRERRGKVSLRQAAEAAGVSFSTFSRVEAGSQPDLTSFSLLCAWLGVSPTQFFGPSAERERDPLEVAISHLSADPRLEPKNATQIEMMLRTMYSALAAEEQDATPMLAVHLRAATVMRPGVPARLNSLLTQMHARLESQIAAGEL
jgi:transcriptional regulator with XRE-family HTH domain